MVKKKYLSKDGEREKFRIKVPKALWDHLPKVIGRKINSDTLDLEKRCEVCALKLKHLFRRAIKGMVNKTILKELVNEICNEELYRTTPLPQIQEIRLMPPQHSDLLQCFLQQVFRTLNIDLKLPHSPSEKHIETAKVPHPYHKLQECCSLYLNHDNCIVDWKTASAKWFIDKADKDLQATVFCYAYREKFGNNPLFRFDVITKAKSPTVNNYYTLRTNDELERFVSLANQIERSVNSGNFYPNETNFTCNECPYADRCKKWGHSPRT